MKTKLYTLISICLFIGAILYQFSITNYFILSILFVLFIILIAKLFIKQTIAFSIILRQLLIIIVTIFSINITHFLLFIILTLVLYYALDKLHKKVLIKTAKRIYYHLEIKNNTLLTLIYLGYGLLSYLIIYLEKIKLIESLDLLYYAFYPYMIIIFILICLKCDFIIDDYITNTYFQKFNKKVFFINILTLILFLL